MILSVADSSAGLCRRGWHLKTATSIFIIEWHHCNYFGVELRFVKGQLKYVVKRKYSTATGIEVKEIVTDSLIAAVASIENPHGYPEKYDFEEPPVPYNLTAGQWEWEFVSYPGTGSGNGRGELSEINWAISFNEFSDSQYHYKAGTTTGTEQR